jgi:hypothetical protein
LRKSEHIVMPRELLAVLRTLLLVPLFVLAALPAPAADEPGGKGTGAAPAADGQPPLRRLLYVAVPGIRDYLEYGGHGILVYDIDGGHKLLRRIPTGGVDKAGKPLNVKGICANVSTGRLYFSTPQSLVCHDLATDKLLWEKKYDKGCDRMSMTPDGKVMFLPSFEGPHWNVIDALSGDVITRIVTDSGAHNTVVGLDGRLAYLGGLKSPILFVADAKKHDVVKKVGPLGGSVRPFTVNGRQTLAFVCVNDLLGFEVADLNSGKLLHRVEVEGFKRGPIKRHGCPSHGIALTPDEKEIWVSDATNQRVHVFDARVMPPKQLQSIALRDEPGWVTFSIDGRYAWPSTGEVIDVKTKKIVTALKDEKGGAVQSEKLVEIDFRDKVPVRAGDQFGIGQVTESASQ